VEFVMADIRVRNLDENIVAQLKDQARLHGKSLEGELRDALTELATRPRREAAEEAAQLREAIKAESGILTDSTPLIREERDHRG
jgi:plasmid stability protein